jgi:H+/gluconate symporter-like permease
MFNLYIRTLDFAGEPIFIAMIYAVSVLLIAAPAPLLICCIVYEFYHRMVNRTLYRKNADGAEGKHDEDADQTRHLGHLLDYVALPIGAMFYTTLPHTLVSFQRLWPTASSSLAYVTSEKMVDEAILRRD